MALNHLQARHFKARHFLSIAGAVESVPEVSPPTVTTISGNSWNNFYRFRLDEQITPIKINPSFVVGMSAAKGELLVKKVLSATFNGNSNADVQILSKSAIISEISGTVDFSGKLRLNDLAQLSDDEIAAVLYVIRRSK